MTNLIISIALTIFGESAGEPFEGKQAVASVVWNRAGGDVAKLESVIKAPKQFSCWNNGARPRVPNDYASRVAWRDCKTLAEAMVAGRFTPWVTATHYHAASMTKPPYWAKDMRLVAIIGGHKFYIEKGKAAK